MTIASPQRKLLPILQSVDLCLEAALIVLVLGVGALAADTWTDRLTRARKEFAAAERDYHEADPSERGGRAKVRDLLLPILDELRRISEGTQEALKADQGPDLSNVHYESMYLRGWASYYLAQLVTDPGRRSHLLKEAESSLLPITGFDPVQPLVAQAFQGIALVWKAQGTPERIPDLVRSFPFGHPLVERRLRRQLTLIAVKSLMEQHRYFSAARFAWAYLDSVRGPATRADMEIRLSLLECLLAVADHAQKDRRTYVRIGRHLAGEIASAGKEWEEAAARVLADRDAKAFEDLDAYYAARRLYESGDYAGVLKRLDEAYVAGEAFGYNSVPGKILRLRANAAYLDRRFRLAAEAYLELVRRFGFHRENGRVLRLAVDSARKDFAANPDDASLEWLRTILLDVRQSYPESGPAKEVLWHEIVALQQAKRYDEAERLIGKLEDSSPYIWEGRYSLFRLTIEQIPLEDAEQRVKWLTDERRLATILSRWAPLRDARDDLYRQKPLLCRAVLKAGLAALQILLEPDLPDDPRMNALASDLRTWPGVEQKDLAKIERWESRRDLAAAEGEDLLERVSRMNSRGPLPQDLSMLAQKRVLRNLEDLLNVPDLQARARKELIRIYAALWRRMAADATTAAEKRSHVRQRLVRLLVDAARPREAATYATPMSVQELGRRSFREVSDYMLMMDALDRPREAAKAASLLCRVSEKWSRDFCRYYLEYHRYLARAGERARAAAGVRKFLALCPPTVSDEVLQDFRTFGRSLAPGKDANI